MAYTPIMPNMKLTAQDMGVPDYMAALQQGLKGSQMAAETVMKPQSLAAALLDAQLKNKHDQTINKYLEEQQRSEIAHRNAQTGEIPLMNQMRQLQIGEAKRKSKLLEENPYYGATGDQGKISMLLYMQQHPEMFGGQQGGQQAANEGQQPPQEQNWMDMLRQNQSSLNVPMRPPEQSATPNQPNYIDQYKQSMMNSLIPKENVYQGPAREALDLERLKTEHPEVYDKAVKMAETKQSRAERLAGGLKPGDKLILNPETGEEEGIERRFTPAEREREEGQVFFETVYPKVIEGYKDLSGQGSIKELTNAAINYNKDPKATKLIDDWLLANKALASTVVSEAATLKSGRTNQAYNRLQETLQSSDVPKFIQKLTKEYGLPSSAQYKASVRFGKLIHDARQQAKQKVPATKKEYYEPEKHQANGDQKKRVQYVLNESGQYVPNQ